MIKLSHFSLAAALLLGLATAAQAHNNNHNNGCNSSSGGGNGNGNCGGGNHNNCNHGGGNHGGGGNGGNGGGNCGPTLRCDAGGPYTVAYAPGSVSIQLNGLDSTGAQDYVWNTTFPGAYFDDAALPNPTLVIPTSNDCSFNVEICLLVKRPGQSKTCCTTVRVRDRQKPVIECPDMAKVISGEDTSPQALGFATATDNCDSNVQISYCDRIVPPDCKADRFAYIIERTWRAVDDDCNVAKCVQIIDVVRYSARLDIIPGACPNIYNRNGCGTIPIAISGDVGFDVTKIQWNSVRLWGYQCTGGPIEPQSLCFGDASTAFLNTLNCLCTNANGDGKLDLVGRFRRSQINCAFDMWDVPAGTQLTLVVTGKLCDGRLFIAQDCMTVQ
jgi:hypothetical protein